MFRITSQLKLCGENITDAYMLEKSFSTFHASNLVLQQQYRERGFQRYSELISCLLVAEQNNELLMKTHQSRPIGFATFPEVNVTSTKIEPLAFPEANATSLNNRAVGTVVVAVNMAVAGTLGIVVVKIPTPYGLRKPHLTTRSGKIVRKKGKVSRRNLPRAKIIFAIGVA